MQIEQRILRNDQLSDSLLREITYKEILSSPILSKSYAEMKIKSGQLSEGKEHLLYAIKGLANLGLQQQLLEALGNLADVFIRLGKLDDAKTILKFLHDENVLGPTENKEVSAFGLIRGAFLLDLEVSYEELLESVFTYILNEKKYFKIHPLLLILWIGFTPRKGSVTTSPYYYWFEQEVKLGHIPKSFLHFVQGLKCYYETNWEDCISHFEQIKQNDLTYAHVAIAQVYRFRVRCRSNFMKADVLNTEVEELVKLLGQYDEDLIIQFFTQVVKYDWYTLVNDPPSAEDAKQKAIAIQQLLQYPALLHELNTLECRQEASSVYQTKLHNEESKFDRQPLHNIKYEPVRFYCFGKFRLVHGDKEIEKIEWKRRKTQELFLYLLLQPAYSAERDMIIELLFVDEQFSEKIMNHLYVVLHDLRKTGREQLGIQELVETKSGMIRLNSKCIEFVDVEQFVTLVSVGEQLWYKDRELAVEMFERAAQTYGELLPNVRYIEWLDKAREKYADMQVSVLKRLVTHSIHEKKYENAKWYIKQWLQIRPLQEEAHYALIDILLKLNRKSEAIASYNNWEQLCQAELGISPMPETKALITRIN